MVTRSLARQLLAAQWQNTLQYPGMLVIWMLETFFVPLVLLLVWLPILRNSPQEASAKIYYVVLPLSTMITGAWHGGFFARKVRTGELNSYLVKPLGYVWYEITNNLSEKLFKLCILLPAVLINMRIFNVSLPTNPSTWLAFGMLLILSAILNFIVELIIGYASFWLDDISGIVNLVDIAAFTFGGRLIPLFLFPEKLYSVASALPFRYLFAFPAEYLSGQVPASELVKTLAVISIWLALALALAIILWKKGLKSFSANGG
jgi:ABC-2 type transport system permease protein